MKPTPWLSYLFDIRVWLASSLILHMFGLIEPPLEPGTTWRQTDTLIIARNFYEGAGQIFFPVTDVAGDKSGIVGCEFPIFNYLISLLSIPFGFHDWFGRLINLLVSTTGIYFFYRSIRDWFGERPAFFAAAIMLVSLWFTYSRTSIPDTFAASLIMIALFYGIRYLYKSSSWDLLIFTALACLGCLSKISSASLLTVLIIPFIYGATTIRHKVYFFLSSALILAVVGAWYFYWVPHLQTFGLTNFFMGMRYTSGAEMLISEWQITLKRFYFTAMKFSGFAVFIAAVCWAIIRKKHLALACFAIPFAVYSMMLLKIAVGFILDAYYVVMFLPPMAFIAGIWLAELKPKWGYLLILVVATEGVSNQIHEFDLREKQKPWLTLESQLNTVSSRNDRIAISGMEVDEPTPMYMAHRRGWVLTIDVLGKNETWTDLARRGCRFIVFAKMHGNVSIDQSPVSESEHFVVYKLEPSVSPVSL
jgi:hypothetical protein